MSERKNRVIEIINSWRQEEGALLPILHAIQSQFGHIVDEDKLIIAEELNLSRAEVHGVVGFYHDFSSEPDGKKIIRLCRAEACQATGSEQLAVWIQEKTGMGFGETSADGSLSLKEVFCLGNCALGPAAEIDGKLLGRVTIDYLSSTVETNNLSTRLEE